MRRQRLRMAATWQGEFLRKPRQRALPLLILLLAASEALWITLLKFDAVNGERAVLTFLALLGTLFASYAAPSLGALVVFSPTVMPWYVIWALPLAIIARFRAWVYFSALVCAAFQVMVDETERGWVLWLEYGLFALLCAMELFRSILRRTRGAHARRKFRAASVAHLRRACETCAGFEL